VDEVVLVCSLPCLPSWQPVGTRCHILTFKPGPIRLRAS